MPLDNEGEEIVPLEEPFPTNEATSPGSEEALITEIEAAARAAGIAVDPPSTEETLRPDPSPEEEQPLPEFDPKHRLDFEGLMYIGALTDEFMLYGHHFKIRTLATDDLLEVALAQQKYQGTMGDNRAYVTALVAASVVTADRKALPEPIGPGESRFEVAFEYVKSSWYPWVIDGIYQHYLILEQRVELVLAAMGKASG